MRWVLGFAFAAVACLAVTRTAAACPCCGPCHKYDRMMADLRGVEMLASVYIAAEPTALPARTKGVMAMLVATTWRSSRDGMATHLRLFDATHPPETIEVASPGHRTVLVHGVQLRRGVFRIMLDNQIFRVTPCLDGKHRRTVCLSRAP